MSNLGDPEDLNLPSDGETIEEVRDLHDGIMDGLVPLSPLDLEKVDSMDDLIRAMSNTAFAGRRLGEAADILEAMVRDPDCFVVMTLSGAMTIAKMGLVVCDMIEQGFVQAVVSTGALMAHGFVEAAGGVHFKHNPSMSDVELYAKGYDRVYDTLELERSLDDVEIIINAVLEEMDTAEPYGSAEFNRLLGAWLIEHVEGRGILKSAFHHRVPVFVPAFTDSEMGLDVGLHRERTRALGVPCPVFDPFRDLDQYTDLIRQASRCGIFTIGGGVPRNWAQQVAPYLEIRRVRLQIDEPLRRFRYGVRICPEPVHWGGLSGCTYQEGVSWGKFLSPEDGGRFAEVLTDATAVWPLLIKAVQERLRRDPPKEKSSA
jgi:deoxyhypusine synthase